MTIFTSPRLPGDKPKQVGFWGYIFWFVLYEAMLLGGSWILTHVYDNGVIRFLLGGGLVMFAIYKMIFLAFGSLLQTFREDDPKGRIRSFLARVGMILTGVFMAWQIMTVWLLLNATFISTWERGQYQATIDRRTAEAWATIWSRTPWFLILAILLIGAAGIIGLFMGARIEKEDKKAAQTTADAKGVGEAMTRAGVANKSAEIFRAHLKPGPEVNHFRSHFRKAVELNGDKDLPVIPHPDGPIENWTNFFDLWKVIFERLPDPAHRSEMLSFWQRAYDHKVAP